MRTNRKLLSGIAILAAVVIFAVLYNLLSRSGTTPPANNTAPVVNVSTGEPATVSGRVAYAVGRIPARAIITPDMFVMKRPASPDVPAATVIANPDAELVGYITRTAIDPKNPINPSQLIGHISDVGIAGALQPGTRAIVLPVANKPTFHDLVRIGNYVDILASFEGQESRTLVQNIRVLAVDVFAKDYPSTNAAMRGPYRADPKGRGIASSPQPGAAAPSGPPAPDATPTPTPSPQQPPPRPDPALTLEVTPQQATDIALAQSAGAAIEYLIRPAPPIGVDDTQGTGGTGVITTIDPDTGEPTTNVAVVPVVSSTRPRIAPYSTRLKTAAASAPRASSGGGSGGGGGTGGGLRFTKLPQPVLPPPTSNIPMPVPAPTTYDIPVYADGKLARVDTVPRPGPNQ